jgi:PBSX family phage terminase large subunit
MYVGRPTGRTFQSSFNALAPFNERQLAFLRKMISGENWLNFAEGGVRAGKNVLESVGWGMVIDQHPDKLHLCAGVSQSTARLNVFDCNGYGLENYFAGRFHYGEYQDKPAMFVNADVGERIILIAGGGKKGDDKYIAGQSYGSVLITEANDCHLDFIKETFNRTIASNQRIHIMDANPDEPTAPFYTEIMDVHARNQKLDPSYGFNYERFTIYDNMSLTDKMIERVVKTYDPATMWYKRDILGMRAVGEGAIFKQVAGNPNKYTWQPTIGYCKFLTFGIDWGGNKSKTAFVATGIFGDMKGIMPLADLKLQDSDETLDMSKVCREFVRFAIDVIAKYPGVEVLYVAADGENQLAIKMLKSYFRKYGISIRIQDAQKTTIMDRILFKERALNAGRYLFGVDAKNCIASTCGQVWDKKNPNTRLDNGTADIDTADAEEYSWTPIMKYFHF